MAMILPDAAYLLVDGRYTLQAAQETDADSYQIINSAERNISACLAEYAKGLTIAYDPWLMTGSQVDRLANSLKDAGTTLLALDENPIDRLWVDQPPRPKNPLIDHALEYAGQSHTDKLNLVAKSLHERRLDRCIISAPDSLCWLLNMRGSDIPFNPLPLVYAMVNKEGNLVLFVEKERVNPALAEGWDARVILHDPASIELFIVQHCQGKSVGYDAERTPIAFRTFLEKAGARIVPFMDPCLAPKAQKNSVEIDSVRKAHHIDGVAVTKFLHWFDQQAGQQINELMIIDKLEEFRREAPEYRGPSFATIAGSGSNGAIVHYRANEASNRSLGNNDILLLDSGGQYQQGTTDITRTMARGEVSNDFKAHFTYVLKGHIALARAQFPSGTTGTQLDALARLPLWMQGLDYDHGTGHGVGAYLCVHEGPQRISKRSSDVALKAGMILSNEPGYYRTGHYGIRIENLVTVVEVPQQSDKPFLGFETLTICPIDTRLVEKSLLNADEKSWLNAYHEHVYEVLSSHLNVAERSWLQTRTSPI